jgi:hypothetical protein
MPGSIQSICKVCWIASEWMRNTGRLMSKRAAACSTVLQERPGSRWTTRSVGGRVGSKVGRGVSVYTGGANRPREATFVEIRACPGDKQC